MFSVLRPFLFNLDPETAHDLAIKSLKLNLFSGKMFEVEDEQILIFKICSSSTSNIFFLARCLRLKMNKF